jgi:hypothetical protein
MTTTTVLSDDTATIVQDSTSRFSWGPVFAGAVIATAVTFLLVSVGSGLGLAMTSAHTATVAGVKTFLTLGAIYFVGSQAFGFAVGGHVTGRLMPLVVDDNEEESFRADAHGLAVWALATVFGLALVALAAFATASASASASTSQATTPAAYWADKLLAPSSSQSRSPAAANIAAASPGPHGATTDASAAGTASISQPNSRDLALGTLADAKAEAARLLAVDAAGVQADSTNVSELTRLVTQFAGLSLPAATDRVLRTEQAMRAKAKEAADAARKVASYVGIWTAIALLFGAIVSVAATVSARWKDEHDMFGRPRSVI